MPFRVLVVKADPKSAGASEQSLLSAGYHVTSASDFEEAKTRLLFAAPDLLITDLRLGAHNGVHLLIFAHASHPDMPGIVLDTLHDSVLEKEVQNEGGVYVAGPCSDQELLGLVEQLTGGLRAKPSAAVKREFPRKNAALSANAAGIEAKVVDVSYRGLRLELPGLPNDLLSRLTSVEIAPVGSIEIRPVWARGAVSTPRWWCGAEVVSADGRVLAKWRLLVDSLN